MSLFKSKCSKSKLPNMKKIAEHSKVFYLKFTDICRQERHAVTVSLKWVFLAYFCQTPVLSLGLVVEFTVTWSNNDNKLS